MGILDLNVAHRFEPRATGLAQRCHRFIYQGGGDALSSVRLRNEQQCQSSDQPILNRRYNSPVAAADHLTAFSDDHAGIRLHCRFQIPGDTKFVQPYTGQLSHERNYCFRVACLGGTDDQFRHRQRRRLGAAVA